MRLEPAPRPAKQHPHLPRVAPAPAACHDQAFDDEEAPSRRDQHDVMMSCSLELLVPDDRPCGDRPARDIQVSWKESSRPQKKRILLVEDYPPTRDVYRT